MDKNKRTLVDMATYHISAVEIRRRTWAYTALITSWIGTQLLLAWIWAPSNSSLGWAFAIAEAITLFLLGFATFYFFYTCYIKSTIELDDEHITRLTTTAKYQILLTDITDISVKKTTRKQVRQVSVKLANGQRYNFDGLADFDEFAAMIKKLCPEARYTMRHERFDYDSVIFYPLLGVTLAVMVSMFVRQATASDNFRDTFFTLFTIYIAAIGGFFAFMRPLAKQYGKKAAMIDYTVAFVLGVFAILLLWLLKF